MAKIGRPVGIKVGEGKRPCLISARIGRVQYLVLQKLAQKSNCSVGVTIEQLIDFYLASNGILLEEVRGVGELTESQDGSGEQGEIASIE